MKRFLLALLGALLLCGCGTAQQETSDEEPPRLQAYQPSDPYTVQVSIDSETLIEAFGNVAEDVQIIERNIKGWHKVQVVFDYPGGRPENWESMCEALSAGTASYKEHTTAELVTPRGALLASAIEGKLTYDAFEKIQEPRKGFEHSEDLSQYDSSSYYVSNKNRFYHIDGTCGALLSRVYYEVGVDDAVDERRYFCPICAAGIRDEVKHVERTVVPYEFPVREEEPEADETQKMPDYIQWNSEYVWLSKSGTKYHSNRFCSNMDRDNAEMVTIQEALSRGRTRCSNCW